MIYQNQQRGASAPEFLILLLTMIAVGFAIAFVPHGPGRAVVEAKSEIDVSTLRLANRGCKVLDPTNSEPFDMTNVTKVPKGSYIRRECFPSEQQKQIDKQKIAAQPG